jgi:hypothetical protein
VRQVLTTAHGGKNGIPPHAAFVSTRKSMCQ